MNTIANKTGRPGVMDDRGRTVAALKGIRGVEGYAEPSRYIKMKLAEAGLISFAKAEPTGSRGRRPYVATLTPKGHATVNFYRED